VSSSSYKIRKTIGIDLGTTNSVIAMLDTSGSLLLTGGDEHGRMTVPSVVAWDDDAGELIAGRKAHARKGVFGRSSSVPLSSVKRFMGLDKPFTLGSETLQPPEVSAVILRHLRDLMARTLNDAHYLLDSAIITMPAYFNHNQIEATRQAGELAGYEVVELLHEPTAAAIYYSWVENHGPATYLVYDLGGGTFDVSIIRKRFDDYEVLSVSGDPFLGGDDFDRVLASYLIESGAVKMARTGNSEREARSGEDPDTSALRAPSSQFEKVDSKTLDRLFDLSRNDGAANFARLVHIAEAIKIELTDAPRVERYVPALVTLGDKEYALEAVVEREMFNRLIRSKVDRTIDCCREALGRAQDKAGLRLQDIDYIVLVGGSSRVPLVRETVRAAFGNAGLPEHVRNLEPLLHEPDLCVAYGAALRAATHGTRFRMRNAECGMRNEEDDDMGGGVELQFTSPFNTRDLKYTVTGIVRPLTPEDARTSDIPHSAFRIPHSLEGGSVRIRSLSTGLTDEVFLDERGTFAHELELQSETDNPLECTVVDAVGSDLASVVVTLRHQTTSRVLGQGVMPTQLITKPLQIEVLSRARQRVKQVIAPIGATLPGVFRCTCRTTDQGGRIVVPIFEENRVIKQMVIGDLDPSLPIGSPVEVDLNIDVKHNIEVKVIVRQGGDHGDRCETATIEGPPPPRRPTRAEIDEVMKQIGDLLPQFTGSYRTRLKAKANQLHQDLLEALCYDDEPKAVQRMAELRELLQNLESSQGQMLDPPWPKFTQLVRKCLELAGRVAAGTGRDEEELVEYINAQERYAEQAYDEHNAALYRECRENLEKYGGYLDQLLRDALPRPTPRPSLPPEEEAKGEVDHFRGYLASVWKQVRAKARGDLEAKLSEVAKQANGLSQRIKTDPGTVIRDARRLRTEVAKIEDQVKEVRRQSSADDAGLLEGSP
jgi:molecular chaperone DnaK